MRPWQKHIDDPNRFAGVAEIYDRYRPGYPAGLFDALVRQAGIEKGGTVLDLGCGTGQLAFEFERRGYNVTGVDPEKDMIDFCWAKDKENKLNWHHGTAEEFQATPDSFDLVVMGRSFHWMDEALVLENIHRWLRSDGIGAVIWNDTYEDNPDAWKDAAFKETLKWAGLDQNKSVSKGVIKHEDIIAASSFKKCERLSFEFDQIVTIDEVIGRYLSFSWCSAQVLGDRVEAFKAAMRDLLLPYADEREQLEEHMPTTALIMIKL